MTNAETRQGSAVEIRAADGVIVSGYAATFGTETNIAGMFREVVAPGAFRSAIGRDDVVFVLNHSGLPLARTSSGTLHLTEDSRGLKIDTSLDPEDPDVQALVPKVRRGDLSAMSFKFIATRQEWDESGDIPLRTLYEVELLDVSIVNRPAYPGTEVGLRSLAEFRSEQNSQRRWNYQAAQRRLRMKQTLG